MQAAVQILSDPDQVSALAHPVRGRVLESLRSPDTAANLARSFGRSRQAMNYHLKALERIGLARHAGERRNGNFVKQLYEATAKRFVVSARFATDPERLASVLRDHVSLSQLVDLGERLQRDAAELIDLAAFEGREFPSASADVEVRFPDESARAAFMADLVESLKLLFAKHGAAEGERFRVTLAAYPDLEEER